MVLEMVKKLDEKFKTKDLINVIVGKESAVTKAYKLENTPYFNIGKEQTENYWKSIIRQATVQGFLTKDIETYGVLKISEKAEKVISGKSKESFLIAQDKEYDLNQLRFASDNAQNKSSGVLDEVLFAHLKSIQKKVGEKHGVPPYTVFMEPSLEDMTIQYPISIEELSNIYGVGESKAKKFGKDFVEYIKKYVEENNIERTHDTVMRTVANKSNHKVFIIQNTDKKIDLQDIAKAKNLTMDELLKEMESIVYQGTKLNINYYIDENFDEDLVEEFMDFMKSSESDSMKVICAEFSDDLSDEEIRMLRIKFISDVAN